MLVLGLDSKYCLEINHCSLCRSRSQPNTATTRSDPSNQLITVVWDIATHRGHPSKASMPRLERFVSTFCVTFHSSGVHSPTSNNVCTWSLLERPQNSSDKKLFWCQVVYVWRVKILWNLSPVAAICLGPAGGGRWRRWRRRAAPPPDGDTIRWRENAIFDTAEQSPSKLLTPRLNSKRQQNGHAPLKKKRFQS